MWSSGLFVFCKLVLNTHVIVHLLVHTFDTSSQFMTSSKPAVSAQKFASGKCFSVLDDHESIYIRNTVRTKMLGRQNGPALPRRKRWQRTAPPSADAGILI